jgi:O-antigen ligase
MAQIVGGLVALALVIAAAPSAIRFLARSEKRTLVIGSLIVAITLFSVAQAVRLDQPLQRWQELSEHLPANARWTANRVAFTGIGDAGWLGLGPGVFRAVFPHYQQASGHQPRGTWRFLHNDYLQTLLEWGWLGSLVVAALFFGGIGIGIRSYLRAKNWSTRQRVLLPCVILALLGVAIHAAVDFPLQILSIQLLVATYLGICWGSGAWARMADTGKRKETGRPPG